jgi:hypothetical protein
LSRDPVRQGVLRLHLQVNPYAELGIVLLLLLLVGVWAVAIIIGIYYDTYWKE